MTLEARINKLEKRTNKGGELRILVVYPNGKRRYMDDTTNRELGPDEPTPIHDTLITIVEDDAPIPNHGASVNLSREGDN